MTQTSEKLRQMAGELSDIALNPPPELRRDELAKWSASLLAAAWHVELGEKQRGETDDGNCFSCVDGKCTAGPECVTASNPPTANGKCDQCNGAGQICVGTSGLECDGNAPILERCESCDGSGTIS
jgi:hypothetical protein